ncbi:MAG: hypothetical protein HZC36_05530 [Armatimonadetes bacterium]|nr:hypothetical protein [Armatimonadota bacterium]
MHQIGLITIRFEGLKLGTVRCISLHRDRANSASLAHKHRRKQRQCH